MAQQSKSVFHPWDSPEDFVSKNHSTFKHECSVTGWIETNEILKSSLGKALEESQFVGIEGFSNINYLDTNAQVYDISKNFIEEKITQVEFNEMKEKYEKEYFPSTFFLTDEATETYIITEWQCKGCNKYFSTKGSLTRHLERKKSCKQIVEKPVVVPEETKKEGLPEKPYIVDWVDQLLYKAISGDTDKPTCKFCEIEFANKGNLNKHLSKSVACDKLAKEEFVKVFQNPKYEEDKGAENKT